MVTRIIILFMASLVWSIGHGQIRNGLPMDTYNKIDGLKLMNVVSEKELIGNIIIVESFSGVILELDSTGKYKMYRFDCTSKSLMERGTWKVFNKRMLEITSNKRRKIFDIVQFDKHYFFVEPGERFAFVSLLVKEVSKQTSNKDFVIDGKSYTRREASPIYLNTIFWGRNLEYPLSR